MKAPNAKLASFEFYLLLTVVLICLQFIFYFSPKIDFGEYLHRRLLKEWENPKHL